MRARGCVALAVVAALGCSGDLTRTAPASAVSPRLSLRAPLDVPAPIVEPKSPVDLESFSPLLALPELSAVPVALEAGDAALAAREADAAFRAHPAPPALAQAAAYLLGKLREDAGDLPGATSAFEQAAQREGLLVDYARLGAGRTALRSGRAEAALATLGLVHAEGPIAEEAWLLEGDAAALAGKSDLAIARYRQVLALPRLATDRAVPQLRLSELLVGAAAAPTLSFDERAALGEEALTLARNAMARDPADTTVLARGRSVEMASLVLLPAAERALRAKPDPKDELERLRVLSDGKQNDAALALGDSILAALGERGRGTDVGCETEILRARALAGLRKWGLAADELGDTARRCKDPDLRARALFLGGRYAESDKRTALAIKLYETLEREIPGHRLADDARVRAAEAYRDMGAEGRFTDLLTRLPDDYPDGDLVLDGLFSLALSRVEKGDYTAAAGILQRAAAIARPLDPKRGQELAGRERYFHARAIAAASEADAARSLDEYEELVRTLPLSYYMLHAYSRLAAADAKRAESVLGEAIAAGATAPFSFARSSEQDDPRFKRALELLRASDVERAKRELVSMDLGPDTAPALLWSVALAYARAGAPKLSNDVSRGLLSDWLVRWPAGPMEKAWEVAFPRPYHDLVAREARKNSVPESLVYAVMREESSFDPDAESPARAYGLMQLIVPTARLFGKPLGLRPDAAALKRPSVNVSLGCRVLAELTRSFSTNPLLAIAGYNAGGGRPRRWLRERPTVDFDVWVELIPFLETRRYMKRVLASRASYAFLYADEGARALELPLRLSAADAP